MGEINFLKEALDIKDEVIKLRRDFHKHPELDYDLFRTCEKVKEFLKNENIEYYDTAGTGVCAIIRGKGHKTVAIRGDMDALPLQEKNICDYSSKMEGKMHACGHDAHTAILLGTAKVLNSIKDKLNGNIKLLFEPAEETTGGARIMIKEGVLKEPEVDAIIGLHMEEKIETGKIGLRRGVVNAASNPFTIKIKGKGSHGARPNNSVDPIIIASNVVVALQNIVSRELPPTDPGVLTIGTIHGGTAQNIIPEEVILSGIIRVMKTEHREYVKKRLVEIVDGICKAMRGECEIDIEESYPCLYNNDEMLNSFINSAKGLIGEDKIEMLEEPSMGVESFAYFSMEKPSIFYYLGCRNEEKGIVHPAHSSLFDVDEDSLPLGVALHCRAAFDILNS
ncbi:amidohydrolase [Clostridium sporogenes]|uniref:M20 metallopeptidase family protein n=1 Tax=Clostridium sporogenes TaxID=1509 RepID=UPI001C128CAC|nr:M20 family metallopeptidase [Clostridium sporogenes]MBU5298690.1 amidohydrolase [Clostridium sporogenes]